MAEQTKSKGDLDNKIEQQIDSALEQHKSHTHDHVSRLKVKIIAGTVILLLAFVGLLFLVAGSDDSDTENSESTKSTSQQETAAEIGSELTLFNSIYHLEGTENCPEISNFIDISRFDGPGSTYPDPSFSVICDGDNLVVSSNNIPHTEFVMLTPNDLEAFDFTWSIPRNPTLASENTEIGRMDGSNPVLGDLGFAVNGVVWYGPTEAEFPDPYGDPFTNSIIDDCGGHHSPYHYHIMVTSCFFPDWDVSQPSPIVGYALDGFPIYGPTGCLDESCDQIVEFKSSYEETGELSTYAWDNVEFKANQGDEYLDECNGRVQPDGSYGYHLTEGFPYIIGCFKGEVVNIGGGAPDAGDPNSQQGGNQQPPPPGGPGGPN